VPLRLRFSRRSKLPSCSISLMLSVSAHSQKSGVERYFATSTGLGMRPQAEASRCSGPRGRHPVFACSSRYFLLQASQIAPLRSSRKARTAIRTGAELAKRLAENRTASIRGTTLASRSTAGNSSARPTGQWAIFSRARKAVGGCQVGSSQSKREFHSYAKLCCGVSYILFTIVER
jgi:hypothetical protein